MKKKTSLMGLMIALSVSARISQAVVTYGVATPPVIASNAAAPWTPPPAPLLDPGPAVVSNVVQYVLQTQAAGGGHFAGPSMPSGLASPQPHSPGGDTAYYDQWRDTNIYGFVQSHVHGTGGSGHYGQIMFMPQAGGTMITSWTNYLATKTNEVLTPYYYSVRHIQRNVTTEIAPTHNAIIYRVTTTNMPVHLVFDLSYKGTMDLLKQEGGCHYLNVTISPDGRTVSGMGRYSGGWCSGLKEIPFYFYIECEKTPDVFGTWLGTNLYSGAVSLTVSNAIVNRKITNDHAGIYFTLNNPTNPVQLKIGLSMRNAENARYFATNQISGFDFSAVSNACAQEWNRRLSRILVEGSDYEVRCFYTFLQDTWMMPRNKTGDDPAYWNTDYWDEQYSTWDTYRSLCALKSLIDRRQHAGMANFLIRCQETMGFIPRAFVAGWGNQWGLNGDTGDKIITEAVLKEIPGVDTDRAYAALRSMALVKGRRPDYLVNQKGWIGFYSPNDLPASIPGDWRRAGGETVEDCIADGFLGKVAHKLGHDEDATLFFVRSRGWTNIWNASAQDTTNGTGITGFMTPRDTNGIFWPINRDSVPSAAWDPPAGTFNVRAVAGEYMGEGNSWDYSMLVNHEPSLLIEKCGGSAAFASRLSYGFANDLFNLGNEPAFFIPWLACYAGRPDITMEAAREVCINRRAQEVYKLGGTYGGGEDSGAMSSRWILWSIGMFPNGGSDVYLLHGAWFNKVTIQLENGTNFTVIGQNAGTNNLYVQSAELNGQPLNRCWLRHSEIVAGGTLRFVMGSAPSAWAQTGPLPPALDETDVLTSDLDGDGLPNGWEYQYFRGATNAVSAAPASNGINTVLETYIAGLDPTDPSARFVLNTIQPLQWTAASGRVYSVYWSSNLLSGFQILESNVPWTGNSFTDSLHGAENQGFYRIKVQKIE